MSLRRFRYKRQEYEQVLQWLKTQKVDEAEDEKSAEPLQQLGFRMPADYLPDVPWAHKAPMRTKVVEHGRIVVEMQLDGWKRLVHENEIDGYLRETLLSKKADVPLSRDAGYHITQKRTLGISRRAFAKFISKQAVLQITRDALPKKKGVGNRTEVRGNLEIDLVEAKGKKDIMEHLHRPTKNFYWITMIDRLTGWLEVERTILKDFKNVVPLLRKMVGKMEKALKSKVKYVRSDSGSEFKSKTREMFKSLGIRHKFVKSGNRLEQANKTYQKTWYRLLRLGRGSSLDELDQQAVAIFNNTLSSINGRTPLEALAVPDSELSAVVRIKAIPKYKAAPIKKGDKCRYLIDKVRGKHGPKLGYKSYRGRHWSADVYSVVNIRDHPKTGVEYYVAGLYRGRDKLLKVPGVDAITRDRVIEMHRAAPRPSAAGYEGWDTDSD
jgi:hypothetical protein